MPYVSVKQPFFFDTPRWQSFDAMLQELTAAAGISGHYVSVQKPYFFDTTRWLAVDRMIRALYTATGASTDSYSNISRPWFFAYQRWARIDVMLQALYTAVANSSVTITSPAAITGSPGGVLTGVPATFSVPGGTSEWLADSLPVSNAATLDSSLYAGHAIQFHSTVTVGNKTASSISAVVSSGRGITSATATFNGTNGQTWAQANVPFTLSGGTTADRASWTIDGNNQGVMPASMSQYWGAAGASSGASQVVAGKDVGSVDQWVEYRIKTVGPDSNGPGSIILALAQADDLNMLTVAGYDTGSSILLFFGAVVGGIRQTFSQDGQSLASGGFPSFAEANLPLLAVGDTLRVEKRAGTVHALVKASGSNAYVEYAVNVGWSNMPSTGATGSGAVIPAGIAASLPFAATATRVGITRISNYQAIAIDDLAAGNFGTVAFQSATVGQPVYGTGSSIALAATSTSAMAQPQARIIDAMGNVVADFTNLTANGTSISGTVGANLERYGGQVLTVGLWDAADHSKLGSITVAVPIRQTVPKTVVGMNEGEVAIGYPNDIFRDFGRLADVRDGSNRYILTPDQKVNNPAIQTPASTAGMGYDGVVRAAGTYLIGFGNLRAPEHAGAATITFGPGVTVNSVGDNGSGSNPSIAGNVVSVTFGGAKTATVNVTFDGRAGGLTYTCAGQGMGGTTTTSAGFRASMAALGTKVWRTMQASGINGDTVAGTTTTNLPLRDRSMLWRGPIGMGHLNIIDKIAICNETGVGLYHNFSHLDGPDMTAYVIELILGQHPDVSPGLNSNLGWRLEHSNEVWNSAPAFGQFFDVMLQGLRNGYAPDAVNSSTQAAPEIVIDGSRLVDPQSHVTSVALNSGDKIMVQFYKDYDSNGNQTGSGPDGFCVFVAKKAVASGTTLPPLLGSDANFDTLYNIAQCERAKYRQHSQRTMDIKAVADAKADAAGRARAVVELGAMAYGGFAAIQPALDWGNAWSKLTNICTAPYWGYVPLNGAFVDISNMTGTEALPGWGYADRQLFKTDVPTWLTKWFAIQNQAIDQAVASAVQYKNDLAAYLVTKNDGNVAHRDDIQLDIYELNVAGAGMYAGADQAAFDPVVVTMLADARQGAAWTRALNGFAAQVGGNINIFCRVFGQSASNPFGIATSEADFALTGGSENYKVAAISAFIVSNP